MDLFPGFEAIQHRMKTGSPRLVNSPMIVARNEMHLKKGGTRIWRQGLVRVVLGHLDVMLRSPGCIDVVASSGGDSSWWLGRRTIGVGECKKCRSKKQSRP